MAEGVRISKGVALVADEVVQQYTTQPLPSDAQIPERFDHQKVVEYENERVLAAKRKAQAAKDKAIKKRSAVEGTSRQTKKKKTDPLTFALDETEGDDSTRSASRTHHSASPLNTIVLDDSAGGNGTLKSVCHSKDDVKHHLDDEGDSTEVNSPYAAHSFEPQPSNHSDEDMHVHSGGGHVMSSSFGGLGRQAFPNWNPGGDGAGSSFFLVRYLFHLVYARYLEGIADPSFSSIAEQEERTKRLEEEIASKTSSLTEAETSVSTLKGDLECLTIDLSHAEIVRHNYVWQLLPTTFQRLLSNDEYKKSLSDVFNQAITAGWSEGVKVGQSEEDAEAILADATDYDPNCKYAFMSAFESILTKSYPYVEKLARSFRLPLGNLQYIWPKGEGPTICSSVGNAQ
nr:hypothetical protein [Tanacetum cinerariifolium]